MLLPTSWELCVFHTDSLGALQPLNTKFSLVSVSDLRLWALYYRQTTNHWNRLWPNSLLFIYLSYWLKIIAHLAAHVKSKQQIFIQLLLYVRGAMGSIKNYKMWSLHSKDLQSSWEYKTQANGKSFNNARPCWLSYTQPIFLKILCLNFFIQLAFGAYGR